MKNDMKKMLGSSGPGPGSKSIWGKFGGQLLITLLIFIVLIALYSAFLEQQEAIEDITLTRLATDIKAGEVAEVVVQGDTVKVTYEDGSLAETRREPDTSLTQTLVAYGVSPETLSELPLTFEREGGLAFWALNILPFLLPVLFIIFLFWMITRQMKGSSMQAFSFGQSKARVIDPNDQKQRVTFKDVAGAKEVKAELWEVVDFLRHPKKFLDIGARIPKGVLMMGPPGSGKTLLARAVAGEAQVPFFYLSGSEFVEMFVGVGASRVRDLFKMAKKAAPAIIFIDEIDAIGRHRGSGMGGGNDEREQTLNQILVEMDGFEPNEKLIVMAATNRPDVLDPALLRPGRFDRRAILDQPDIKDREEILTINTKNKVLDEDVVLSVVAARTPGFSGADLANAVNEAAILAARENRKKIAQKDFLRSVEKVMMGPERKSHVLSEREKKITAYHEMGHALTASLLPNCDPVHKVSIVSRGQAAGYTLKLPFEDKRLNSRKEFLDDMVMALGGYAAELLTFGDVTTGASNDLQVSSDLARNMVTRYGMSDKVGPVSFSGNGSRITGEGSASRSASESMRSLIDQEVSRIVSEALEQAKKLLEDNKDILDAMTDELIKVETLEREDFEKILREHGIEPKQPYSDKKTQDDASGESSGDESPAEEN